MYPNVPDAIWSAVVEQSKQNQSLCAFPWNSATGLGAQTKFNFLWLLWGFTPTCMFHVFAWERSSILHMLKMQACSGIKSCSSCLCEGGVFWNSEAIPVPSCADKTVAVITHVMIQIRVSNIIGQHGSSSESGSNTYRCVAESRSWSEFYQRY